MIKNFPFLSLILFSEFTFSQAKAEKINVLWPAEEQFNLIENEKKGKEITAFFCLRKVIEKNWTMLGTIKTYKNTQTTYSDSVWSNYKKILLLHSSNAIFTYLEKNEAVPNQKDRLLESLRRPSVSIRDPNKKRLTHSFETASFILSRINF